MTKYPVLVIVSNVVGFVGWLFVIVGGLISLWGASDLVNGVSNAGQTNFQDLQVPALAGLRVIQGWIKLSAGIGLATSGLVSVAISEAVRVFIDIENNTAQAVGLLKRSMANSPTSVT